MLEPERRCRCWRAGAHNCRRRSCRDRRAAPDISTQAAVRRCSDGRAAVSQARLGRLALAWATLRATLEAVDGGIRAKASGLGCASGWSPQPACCARHDALERGRVRRSHLRWGRGGDRGARRAEAGPRAETGSRRNTVTRDLRYGDTRFYLRNRRIRPCRLPVSDHPRLKSSFGAGQPRAAPQVLRD